MFVNLSNHPVNHWSQDQLQAAREAWGEIVDVPFPHVDPNVGMTEVRALAIGYRRRVLDILQRTDEPSAVHVMGEATFVVAFAMAWVEGEYHQEYPLVVSTTERDVVELPDGTKQSRFRFVRFRQLV